MGRKKKYNSHTYKQKPKWTVQEKYIVWTYYLCGDDNASMVLSSPIYITQKWFSKINAISYEFIFFVCCCCQCCCCWCCHRHCSCHWRLFSYTFFFIWCSLAITWNSGDNFISQHYILFFLFFLEILLTSSHSVHGSINKIHFENLQ